MVTIEPERLIHVLQEPSGRRNEDIHARQPLLLVLQVLSADDEAGREVVLVAYLAEDFEDLDSLRDGTRSAGSLQPILMPRTHQFACRRNDKRAESVLLSPPLP